MIETEGQWVDFREWYLNCRYYKLQTTFENTIVNLRDYLSNNDIKTVVMGVSGGLDSSVVLAMLVHIKKTRPELEHLKIVARCFTFNTYFETSYTEYVDHLIEKFSPYANIAIGDMSFSLNELLVTFPNIGDRQKDVEHASQVAYQQRYGYLFALAQYHGGITIGTTNKDEFGYSGWFGKTSDMLVDIQPIIRLHKFEVHKMGQILGVPEEILGRVPEGDLIDGSSDESNFGCSYNDLSAFTHYMEVHHKQTDFLKERFKKLIALHNKNAHKYQGQGFNPIFL